MVSDFRHPQWGSHPQGTCQRAAEALGIHLRRAIQTGHLPALETQEPWCGPRDRDQGLVKTKEGKMTMKTTTAVKDVVCGMDVEPSTAAGQTEHKGKTYYFCASKCKEKFDLKPEQYLGKSAGAPKSGKGCCGG